MSLNQIKPISKVYFPNLNGLRFIAAFVVIITHIEQIKGFKDIHNSFRDFPYETGKLGVTIFFVLSGFLITYLILEEESITQKINVRKFYTRRILRIWPIYFFIIFISLFILPNFHFFTWRGYEKETLYISLNLKIILFLFFMPNLVLSLLGVVPYASQTWSVGSEEQFYLFWPWVFKLFRENRILILILLIIIYEIIDVVFNLNKFSTIPYYLVLKAFWTTFNIDRMAFGGILAVLLFKKSAWLKYLLNNYVFYTTLTVTLLFWINSIKFPFFHFQIFSILFGILIINFAANHKIGISFENPFFNYLGKISYGLYMYHPIGIVFAIGMANSANILNNWFIYPFSFLFTIIISGISYKYFEKYFLKMKDKFIV